jgi:transcriptional regulator with XRE-family HTH domain
VSAQSLVAEVQRERQLPSARVLKGIREMAGVSQQRLADELGVHRVSVARWEIGTRRPHGELLGRYLELLEALQVQL